MTTESQEQTAAVAVRQPDAEIERIRQLGHWLALSEAGGNDEKSKGASAALRLYYAKELGLPPLAASELSVIKGRLFVQAKLLRSLAAQRGYRVVRDAKSNGETCTAILIRADTGEEVGRATFTIQDAKTAGLVRDQSAWKSHPARMLWARASKFVLDDYAPEVTLGIQTDDERDEIEGRPTPAPHREEPQVEDAEWEPTPEEQDRAQDAYDQSQLPDTSAPRGAYSE